MLVHPSIYYLKRFKCGDAGGVETLKVDKSLELDQVHSKRLQGAGGLLGTWQTHL